MLFKKNRVLFYTFLYYLASAHFLPLFLFLSFVVSFPFHSLEVQIPISASPQRAFCRYLFLLVLEQRVEKLVRPRAKRKEQRQRTERERERERCVLGVSCFLKCFCRNEKAPSAKRNRRRTSSNAHLATLDLFWSHISSSSSSSSPSRRLRPPSMWGVARQKKARSRVFFLTAFWKEDLWKKKVNPFPTENKNCQIQSPHRAIPFVRSQHAPFHRWARSKRRSNKLHRPFLNFTTNKTFCATTSNSPPIAMRLDRKSKSFNTKRKNTS